MKSIIQADVRSPRVQYIFEHLLQQIVPGKPEMTYARESPEGELRIYYGNSNAFEGVDIVIPSSGILNEGAAPYTDDIRGHLKSTELFFRDGNQYRAHFDFPGVIFYLLSRMEEYGFTSRGDALGRFSSRDSLLADSGLLRTALVDRWTEAFRRIILAAKPEISLRPTSFEVLPTCDIDSFYAIKGRTVFHSGLSGINQLLRGDFPGFSERVSYHFGRKETDPYDTLNELAADAEMLGAKLRCFVLFPWKKNDPRDRTGLDQLFNFREQLTTYNNRVIWGLHPSLSSGGSGKNIAAEKDSLEQLTGKPATISRQHFLNLGLPETYRTLIEVGIKEDYSMGFHDAPGFRAGTSRPFFWYDLQNEEQTGLKVYPLVLMDASLRHYLKANSLQSHKLIDELLEETKSTKGIFSYLWHNSSLSNFDGWGAYKSVYKYMISKTRKLLQ
jgi:hypothetical protein